MRKRRRRSRRSRRARRKRWLLGLTVLVALYAVGGFLIAPPLVRSQLVERLGAVLQREVAVDNVRINPFTCSVTIEGLDVVDPDGAELAGWQSAHVNFDPLTSLFRWQWHFGEIRLVGPHQHVRIASDGTLNISDLLPPSGEDTPEPAEALRLPAVGVSRLLIQDWLLEFMDESRRTPFRSVSGPMTFSLTNFSTKAEEGSPYAFDGTTDAGTSFSWSGTISALPLGSTGRLESTGISLPKHMPLAEEFLHGRVTSGELAFNTEYAVALTGEPTIKLSNSTLALEDLAIAAPEDSSGDLALGRLEITMPAADLLTRTAEISRVAVDGLVVRGTRRNDGTIDLLDLVPASAPEPSTEEPASASSPALSVAVAEIAVVNSAISITDETNVRTTTLALSNVSATATNAGTDLDREIGIEANLTVNDGGTVAVNGRLRVRPFAAQLNLSAAGIGLSSFDAYLPPPTDVRVLRGTFDAEGQVEAERTAGEQMALRWFGNTTINRFGVADSTERNELVSWDRLALTGMQLSLPPLAASIQEITWDAPVIRATVTADGRFNLLAALGGPDDETTATESAPPSSAEATTTERTPFTATIGGVIVNNGQIMASDRSTSPEFLSVLRDLSGSIRGLSSDPAARAEVDLHGVLDGTGRLAITGTINPLAEEISSDVDVRFHDIALPTFTPYSGRYLGRTIKTGTLNLDLSYQIADKQVHGDNRARLDQFFLGDAVASDEAIKLPIGLALAVLRDRAGVIELPPTPVSGNLDDPDFQIGPLVMHALTNVFVKAATAPFALLGGMFGAREDQDLSYADFAAGSAELSSEAGEKIPILAKAMFESPALRLVIHSRPLPEIDRPVLREQKFAELLREEKRLLILAWSATTGRKETPATSPDAEVTVSAEEVDELVRYAFVRRFPERAAEVDLADESPPEESDGAPVPAEPPTTEPDLVKKILRTVFGGGDRAPTAAPERATTEAGAASTAPTIETAPEATLTMAEMRERLYATIEIPDVSFQDLAQERATVMRDQLIAAGNVEPERITIADQPVVPEGAQRTTDAARVFFGLQ